MYTIVCLQSPIVWSDFSLLQVVFAKDAHFALEDLSNSGYDIVSLDWTMKPTHAR